jgi:hypothetical protein
VAANSAESGNDHDGSCHRSAPRQPRYRPRELREFIAVHSEQVCSQTVVRLRGIELGNGGMRVAWTGLDADLRLESDSLQEV